MTNLPNLSLLGLALLALAACEPATPSPSETNSQSTGAQDYADNCAVCHGATGHGDGEMAADLAKKPADLTRLSANNGGDFPTTRVMAQIWGYAGMKGQGVMPSFAPLMEGELVPYDGGDGIETPTPIRLVELAQYLMTLQE